MSGRGRGKAKPKVIVEPAGTEDKTKVALEILKGKTPTDPLLAEGYKVMAQAEAIEKQTQPIETENKKPATAATKHTEPSQYQVGYDDGYKTGFKDSATRTVHGFVATIEQKLAEHDGYADPEKWRREATIPAWWIAVLITHLG